MQAIYTGYVMSLLNTPLLVCMYMEIKGPCTHVRRIPRTILCTHRPLYNCTVVHMYTEIMLSGTLVHGIKIAMYVVHRVLLVHMYTEINWPCTLVHGIKMAMYLVHRRVFGRLYFCNKNKKVN